MDGLTRDVDGRLAGRMPDEVALVDLLHGIDVSGHLERRLSSLFLLSCEPEAMRLNVRSMPGPVIGTWPGAAVRLIEYYRTRLDAGDADLIQEFEPGFIGVILVGREGDDEARPCRFAMLALPDGTAYWVRHYWDGETATTKAAPNQGVQQRLTAALRDLAIAAARCVTPRLVSDQSTLDTASRSESAQPDTNLDTPVTQHVSACAAGLGGENYD